MGPTILEATTDMDCYQCVSAHIPSLSSAADLAPPSLPSRQEIFGPVLVVVKAANLDEGIKLINRNRCKLLFPFLPLSTSPVSPSSRPSAERLR